ncbi:hypothetical protein B0J13DRAFT_466218, partial [Dactylonectria estremocensis]
SVNSVFTRSPASPSPPRQPSLCLFAALSIEAHSLALSHAHSFALPFCLPQFRRSTHPHTPLPPAPARTTHSPPVQGRRERFRPGLGLRWHDSCVVLQIAASSPQPRRYTKSCFSILHLLFSSLHLGLSRLTSSSLHSPLHPSTANCLPPRQPLSLL